MIKIKARLGLAAASTVLMTVLRLVFDGRISFFHILTFFVVFVFIDQILDIVDREFNKLSGNKIAELPPENDWDDRLS